MKYTISIVICSLCFTFVTFLKPCSADDTIAFDKFLSLFQNCRVKLNNYQNIQLSITQAPVVLKGNVPFFIEKKFSNYVDGKKGWDCWVVFYIFPGDKIERRREIDPYRPREMQQLDIRERYDILVDRKDSQSKAWELQIKSLFAAGVSSFGLKLTVSENENGNRWQLFVENQIGIVKRLQMNAGKFVLEPLDLNLIMQASSEHQLKMLYKAAEDANDISNNWDIPWSLVTLNERDYMDRHSMDTDDPGGPTEERLLGLQSQLKQGVIKFSSVASILESGKASDDNLKNYLFALIALGYNANVTTGIAGPMIEFNVKYSQLMKKPREWGPRFGVITCSRAGMPRPYRMSLWQVIVNFLAIFECKIYLAMLTTYILPCFLLGCIYHGLLRNRIQEKYQLKWHPFFWGVRALIRQAGDRRMLSNRAGFMIWVSAPLMLMAVVLTYAFCGRNVYMLGRGAEPRRDWVELTDLLKHGVILLSDIKELSEEQGWGKMQANEYTEIAASLQDDYHSAYVSKMNRIQAVAKAMKGRCGNWMPVRKSGVYDDDAVRGFAARQLFWRNGQTNGWMIERWGDNRVVRRLMSLDGQSGVVQKWRKVLKGESGSMFDDNYYAWVTAINMRSYVMWVWVLGIWCFAVGGIVWVLEWSWYFVWTKPRQRRIQGKLRERMEKEEAFKKKSEQQAKDNQQQKKPDVLVMKQVAKMESFEDVGVEPEGVEQELMEFAKKKECKIDNDHMKEDFVVRVKSREDKKNEKNTTKTEIAQKGGDDDVNVDLDMVLTEILD